MAFVYNSLIPELLVRDLARSKDFYVGLCGFKIEYERAEEHQLLWRLEHKALIHMLP